MNYRLAYAIGFHPWEDLAEHPPFAGSCSNWWPERRTGASRRTVGRSTSARAAGSGACSSRSAAGR